LASGFWHEKFQASHFAIVMTVAEIFFTLIQSNPVQLAPDLSLLRSVPLKVALGCWGLMQLKTAQPNQDATRCGNFFAAF